MQSANKNIEDILNSLDGIKKAEARPFMYTRIMERLQEDHSFWGRTISLLSRPVIAFSCLAVVLLANVFTIINSATENQQESVSITSSNTVTDVLQNDNFILAVNGTNN